MSGLTVARRMLVVVLFGVVACGAGGVRAGEMDADTARKLESLHEAIDRVRSPVPDLDEYARAGRGEILNQAFVTLTGEAVNPLFGVAVLGVYNYIRADDAQRAYLPVYDRPVVWVPLLVIIFLMLFNSTLCEAMPWLKVPLNALGDLVNKAGAAAVLPLVVKAFADTVAAPLGEYVARAAGAAFPAAYAAEGAAGGGGLWQALGWLGGAAAGTVIYLAVWMTFNVVDVLIVICPFPGVDAMLKGFRLAVLGALAGSAHMSPTVSFILALAVAALSFFVSGWSFRLSVFGLAYSTDIVFLRRDHIAGPPLFAFSSTGLNRRDKVPMRTLGRLEREADGGLWFSYRPWLVRARRRVRLGDSGAFFAGVGLLNPFVVADGDKDMPWVRLAPRFRGREEELRRVFALGGVVDCGLSGSVRSWLEGIFGGKPAAA